MSSFGEQLASGVRWSVLRQVGLTVIGTAAILIYTRVLGPDGIGTFTFATIFYSALLLLIQAPFRDAVIYFQERPYAEAAFFWLLGLGIPAALLVILGAPWIGQFYESVEAVPIIQGMTVVFILRSLAVVPAALLLQQFDFKYHEGFQLLADIAFTVVIVITLVVFNFGVMSMVLAHLAAATTWLIIVWWRTGFRPSWRHSREIYQQVWGFARNLLGSQGLKYANLNIDQILVGRLGEGPLGLYSFSERQSNFIVVGIGVPMFQITLPALSAVKHKKEQFQAILLKMMRLTHTASIPYHLFIFILADRFINLFFGEEWLPAAPLLRAYLIFRLLQTLGELCDAALSAKGRPDLRLKFDVVLFPLFALTAYLSVTWSANLVVIAGSLATIRAIITIIYISVTLNLAEIKLSTLWQTLQGNTLAAVFSGGVLVLLRQILPNWVIPSPFLDSVGGQIAEFSIYSLTGLITFLLFFYLLDREGIKDVISTAVDALLPASTKNRLSKRFAFLRQQAS